MTQLPHVVSRHDEQRHIPAGDELWNESHYADFVSQDGSIAGYVRLGLYPNQGVAWWTTMIVGPRRTLVASVAFDLPSPPSPSLHIEVPGYQIDCTVTDPLRELRIAARVDAMSYIDPVDLYRQRPGEPTPLAIDLAWSTDGTPYHYDLTTRYEIPCLVRGTLTVGAEDYTVYAQGQRDHSWGVRDWWAFGWCWTAARLEDGTRIHATDVRIPGSPVCFGYVQEGSAGGSKEPNVLPVTGLQITEELGEHGLPRRAQIALHPQGITLEVEPLAFGPLLLTASDGRTSRFPRALARFDAADGRTGAGWIEWNQPQSSPPSTSSS